MKQTFYSIFFFFFFFEFSEKISIDISYNCPMKCQDLFSLKNKNKKFKMPSDVVVIGALRVNG